MNSKVPKCTWCVGGAAWPSRAQSRTPAPPGASSRLRPSLRTQGSGSASLSHTHSLSCSLSLPLPVSLSLCLSPSPFLSPSLAPRAKHQSPRGLVRACAHRCAREKSRTLQGLSALPVFRSPPHSSSLSHPPAAGARYRGTPTADLGRIAAHEKTQNGSGFERSVRTLPSRQVHQVKLAGLGFARPRPGCRRQSFVFS